MPGEARSRLSLLARIGAALCGALLTTQAAAVIVLPPGTQVFTADDGPIQAQFFSGASALFDNELYLDSPTNSLGRIFHNHTTPVGTVVALGSFATGTELVFRNHVVDTGDDFFTGPASRNPDGLAHAQVELFTNAEVAAAEIALGLPANTLIRARDGNFVARVGFEDLFGGGDLDYNDLRYLFNNVTSPIPEPSHALLLLAGLGLLAVRRFGGRPG